MSRITIATIMVEDIMRVTIVAAIIADMREHITMEATMAAVGLETLGQVAFEVGERGLCLFQRPPQSVLTVQVYIVFGPQGHGCARGISAA